jgi:hypothetical protein
MSTKESGGNAGFATCATVAVAEVGLATSRGSEVFAVDAIEELIERQPLSQVQSGDVIAGVKHLSAPHDVSPGNQLDILRKLGTLGL